MSDFLEKKFKELEDGKNSILDSKLKEYIEWFKECSMEDLFDIKIQHDNTYVTAAVPFGALVDKVLNNYSADETVASYEMKMAILKQIEKQGKKHNDYDECSIIRAGYIAGIFELIGAFVLDNESSMWFGFDAHLASLKYNYVLVFTGEKTDFKPHCLVDSRYTHMISDGPKYVDMCFKRGKKND